MALIKPLTRLSRVLAWSRFIELHLNNSPVGRLLHVKFRFQTTNNNRSSTRFFFQTITFFLDFACKFCRNLPPKVISIASLVKYSHGNFSSEIPVFRKLVSGIAILSFEIENGFSFKCIMISCR